MIVVRNRQFDFELIIYIVALHLNTSDTGCLRAFVKNLIQI